MSDWHLGRMAPFDLETTGTDPETARIVEAFAAMPRGDRPAFSSNRDLFDDVAVDLLELHEAQKRWAAEQNAGLAEYFRKQAARAKTADEQLDLNAAAESLGSRHWPLTPYAEAAVSA